MLSEAPSAKEVKLAKSLVHPEKSVRDKTFLTVKAYVASIVDIDDLDMLKLWKALYYCMWLADKQAVQMELANELANLSDNFRNHNLRMKYFTLFFRLILREWSFLDQYRVNKFYSLIRIVLNKLFSIAKQENWNEQVIETIVTMLDQEILTKTPNGIRYHIADIYLHELLKVTDGSIETKTFDKILTPFYSAMIRVDDSTFIDRVSRSVFGTFIQDLCHEAASADEADKKVFSTVNTKAVQKKIFDLASDENTQERFRKKLYDLHKSIATKTRVQFVSDEMLVESTKSSSNSSSKTEKPKSKKEKRSIQEEPVETVEVPAPKKAKTEEVVEKKQNQTETKVEAQKVAETKPKKVAEKPAKKAVEEAAPKTKQEEAPAPKTESKKESTPASSTEEKPTYIVAKKFEGAKRGYVFKKGDRGLGYYVDVKPVSAFARKEDKKVTFSKGVKQPKRR